MESNTKVEYAVRRVGELRPTGHDMIVGNNEGNRQRFDSLGEIISALTDGTNTYLSDYHGPFDIVRITTTPGTPQEIITPVEEITSAPREGAKVEYGFRGTISDRLFSQAPTLREALQNLNDQFLNPASPVLRAVRIETIPGEPTVTVEVVR